MNITISYQGISGSSNLKHAKAVSRSFLPKNEGSIIHAFVRFLPDCAPGHRSIPTQTICHSTQMQIIIKSAGAKLEKNDA
jgi:hypothetical protein